MTFDTSSSCYQQLDNADILADRRSQFYIPVIQGEESIYFCGNSLGLQPVRCAEYVQAELDNWAQLGVEGHTEGEQPWMSYHESVTEALATLVGGLPQEVVAMNALTVNLHLLMAGFYKPTADRYKIIIEGSAFPSDRYAVISQLASHGYSAEQGLIELEPRPGEALLREEDILQAIADYGEQTGLILLGGINYLTGQVFPMAAITEAGHAQGVVVGLDLAHAVGNIALNLHDWQVDFAAWCHYKYLNAGPGTIAGSFIHEKHLHQAPPYQGWWGHDKTSRFAMPADFQPIAQSAEAWQLSNPPILLLAALRAALVDFSEVTMPVLRAKSERLTAYLEFLLQVELAEQVRIVTPGDVAARGSQLSLLIQGGSEQVQKNLKNHGVIADFRQPNILRVAPTALYNRFSDVFHFVKILKQLLQR